ncbi:hypothetical protein VPH35_042257 [Triticum aestivum]
MASIWQAKLLFLALLLAFATTSYAHGGGSLELRCHPDQAATLLQLKKSFFFDEAATSLSSWKEGTDCCRWEGVGCGGSSGRVTALSLSRLGLMRSKGLNPVICNLTCLKFLDLSMTDFSEYNMSAVGLERLTFLTHLNLSNSNLEGEIPAGIGKLKNLVSLDLSSEDPSDDESDIHVVSLPNSLWISDFQALVGNLSNLRELRLDDISDCGFLGRMPSSIGNLVNLRSLSLHSSYFSGKIPSTIGNLTNLRRLDISDCGFIGPLPTAIGNLADLRSLTIYSSGFSGPIPCTIGFLTNLESLRFFNSKFTGTIPYTSGNLSSLQSMDFTLCKLSGPIPHEVGKLKELTALALGVNTFSRGIPYSIGVIPASLFNVPLQYLDLSGNQLFGPIKEFNVVSSDLEYLSLERNKLNGKIPRSFFELTNLVSMFVGWNNLVGKVELTSFQRLTKLHDLRLSHNKLSIVDGEGNNNSSSSYLSRLSLLGLASCKITKFSSILTRLGDVGDLDLIPMHALDLSSNGLQGQIPMPYSSAVFLDYSDNNFSSVLPNFTLYLGTTTYLRMSNNSINGHIPQSVCNFRLDFLDLSYNNFSGGLPSCLIEYASLTVLNLRENHFEGTLPSDITSECTFGTVDLHGNKIEGQLPRTLSNCKELEVFDIGNNLIVDTFPSWLGELPNLYVLILRSNHFYGYINYSAGNHQSKDYFSSLQIIDLASNNFSGTLNTEWFGQLKSMMAS